MRARTHDELAAYLAAQDVAIRRWMEATALPVEEWAARGYAAAFEAAWNSRVRDHKALYQVTLDTAARVNVALSPKNCR